MAISCVVHASTPWRPRHESGRVDDPVEGAAGFHFHKQPINYLNVGPHIQNPGTMGARGACGERGRSINVDAPSSDTREWVEVSIPDVCVPEVCVPDGTRSPARSSGIVPANVPVVKMWFSVSLAQVSRAALPTAALGPQGGGGGATQER